MARPSKDTTKHDIVQYCKVTPDVSFAELEARFGDANSTESGTLTSRADPNIVTWIGSKNITAAVAELLKEGRIKMQPCNLLIYALDGHGLRLPIAKTLPNGGYKTPHWLPVTINLTKGKPN